jgi:hypothetical protein
MTQIAADENEAFTASSVHHCHCFHPQMTQIAADENEAFNLRSSAPSADSCLCYHPTAIFRIVACSLAF